MSGWHIGTTDSLIVMGSQKPVSANHNFWKERSRTAEAESNRGPSAYRLTRTARTNRVTSFSTVPFTASCMHITVHFILQACVCANVFVLFSQSVTDHVTEWWLAAWALMSVLCLVLHLGVQSHEHRFPAPSSKLCRNWLRHWRSTLHLRAAVYCLACCEISHAKFMLGLTWPKFAAVRDELGELQLPLM